ncbi:hypothetical protein QJQ45_009791 [Haematococcus lacustris]|nr:hypothetical protein QJQ45_009791 [Haematococcus lacustris]
MSEHAELNLSATPAGHTCPGKSYIAAGFVKWIEAAGGRAVPIRFYASDEELYRMFKSINGLVFPGGLTWLWLDAPYVITARKLFNWAVQANDAGDVFPIHGTCLGFQLLHILASNISRNVLLVDTDSVAHPTTLKFWAATPLTTAACSPACRTRCKHLADVLLVQAHLRDALESPEQNIVLQNHMYGMPPTMYTKHPVLASWYNIISTSMDRNGTEYISTMEGKKYPFTGMCLALLGSLLDAAAALTGCGDCGLAVLYTRTQWHPEKPPSEFGMLEVPHSIEAISVSQHLANMFMESARRSSHVPESKEEELALLIYDTCPVFSERFETTDEENYDGPDITYYL